MLPCREVTVKKVVKIGFGYYTDAEVRMPSILLFCPSSPALCTAIQVQSTCSVLDHCMYQPACYAISNSLQCP